MMEGSDYDDRPGYTSAFGGRRGLFDSARETPPEPTVSREESLTRGLLIARNKLVQQQTTLAMLNEKIVALNELPFSLGTVLRTTKKKWRPEPGLSVTVTSGGHRGAIAKISEVQPKGVLCALEPRAASQQRGVSDDDPLLQLIGRITEALDSRLSPTQFIQLRWKRSWTEVIAPADDVTTVKLVTIALGNGQRLEVNAPPDLRLRTGDSVRLHPQTNQIMAVDRSPKGGEMASVDSVLADGVIEVEYRGDKKAVLAGRFKATVKPGDRVQLDPSGTVVTKVYAAAATAGRFAVTTPTNVGWDAIGGQTEAKQKLIEALVAPQMDAELFAYYKRKPVKGVLLQGPPGCGKTLLAKAVATAVAQRDGGAAPGGFLYLAGTEVMNQWLGNSEGIIRSLFAQARAFYAQHGFPAVICIDECEAVMRKRGESGGRDFLDTFVPTFLVEMDGLKDSGAIVILLTNRADVLDPAILRDGRLNHLIDVRRPNEEELREIFKIHLQHLPLADNACIEGLAKSATAFLCAGRHVLATFPLTTGGTAAFTLKGLRSGSLVEGIVEEAKMVAIRRDRATGTRSGISLADLKEAIHRKAQEKKSVDHVDAAIAFFQEFPPKAGGQEGDTADGSTIDFGGTGSGPREAN